MPFNVVVNDDGTVLYTSTDNWTNSYAGPQSPDTDAQALADYQAWQSSNVVPPAA